MKAYRTYLIVKDPKRVVLSNLPFHAGQKIEIVVLAKDEDRTARVQELTDLFKATQSLPQARVISEDDVMREVEAYRSGH
ncbi:MAG: hypothetical protein ACR2LC_01895 [Pyrinomonadaceae bacterium]